ncbi:NTP transferase domain-containing protein [Arcticibacter sp. MXS-1]|uniref:NTP transferase domain-containing protein n=1 Tax=Arcticibacter sp. MXS-1 TaxID=3341726 RepID=UPI0035A99045
MTIKVPRLNGLILSGGKSTRMGRDKGALVYHRSDQRSHLSGLLKPYCQEVYVSCNPAQAPALAGMSLLVDSVEGAGPVVGILSAFKQEPHAAWLVVACDLPFLSALSLAALTEGRNPHKLATAFNNPDTGFPEPLITIWEPRSYAPLLENLGKGITCPRKVLINGDIQLLSAPDIKELQNINHAEEYDKIVGSGQTRASASG